MPYPFVQWPTFGEFRQRLQDEFGCTYHPEQGFVNDVPHGVLERSVDGSTRRYTLPYTDDERLAPSVIRSIYAHLHVDGSAFGLTLE